jgi:PAB-dependent poly(A)-specific ribonuclease subunit 2
MTALDVSSSSQAVCLGNGGGSLHLLTSGGASPLFNAYSRPTELPDPIHPYEPISMDDPMAVYSSVPLPITSGPLLSDWPNEFIRKQYRYVLLDIIDTKLGNKFNLRSNL